MTWLLVFALIGVTIPDAEAKLRAGQYTEALKMFQELYALDANNVRILKGLAQSYEGLGDRENALTYYFFAWQAAPGDPQVVNRVYQLAVALGQEDLFRNDLESARTRFEMATTVAPGRPRAHFLLGTVYERMGQTARAIQEYRRARSLPLARKALRRLEERRRGSSPRAGAPTPPAEKVPPGPPPAPEPSLETARTALPDTVQTRIENYRKRVSSYVLKNQWDSALLYIDSILALDSTDLQAVQLRLEALRHLEAPPRDTMTPAPQGGGMASERESNPWLDRLERISEAWSAFLAPYPAWMVYGGGGILLFFLLLSWLSIRQARRRMELEQRRRARRRAREEIPETIPPAEAPPRRTRKKVVKQTPPPVPKEEAPEIAPPPEPESASPRTEEPEPLMDDAELDDVWAVTLEEALKMEKAREEAETPQEKPAPQPEEAPSPLKMLTALLFVAMSRKQGAFRAAEDRVIYFGPGYIAHARWGDLEGEEALKAAIREGNPTAFDFQPGAIPPVRITLKVTARHLQQWIREYKEKHGG